MIKNLCLFSVSLLIMAVLQGGTWWQKPAISSIDKYDRIDTEQVRAFPEIAEDTLNSTGRYWHKRNGCFHGDIYYSGYVKWGHQRIAVILNKGQQQLYMIGDSVDGRETARVISLDDQYIVLRYPTRISVLCREFDKDTSKTILATSVTTSSATEVSAIPASVSTDHIAQQVYHSDLGTIAPVIGSQGEIRGYRLQECRQYCWLLRYLDLKESDVLISIQGKDVSGMSLQQITNTLIQSGQDIELSLLRDGKPKIVSLPWKKISELLHLASVKGATQ